MDPFFLALLDWIKKNDRGMHAVDLRVKTIKDEGAEALAEALRHNTIVTHLDLTRNRIGDRGVSALARVLWIHPTLTKVQLGVNCIGLEGAKGLADALKCEKNKLRCLLLVGNEIGCRGAVVLASALRTNQTLRELGLEQNCVEDEGAIALGEAIKVNDSLSKLELGSNNIGSRGAEALSEGLGTNRSISVLGLDGNDIGDEGAIFISRALRSNTSLTWLCLGRNSIGVRGAQSLADAIYDDRSPEHVFGSNHTIKHIYGVQSTHEDLRTCLRWNKAAGTADARQRKMTHFMAENPNYPQRAQLDRKFLPKLLYKIGKNSSTDTMYQCLIEMPEIFQHCQKADEAATGFTRSNNAADSCRWRRIRHGHDKTKVAYDAFMLQTQKSKGVEKSTFRMEKSRSKRS